MTNEVPIAPTTVRVEAAPFGSIELPSHYRTTVETSPDLPITRRYLFDHTVIAVTGGAATPDVRLGVDATFAQYANASARWASDGMAESSDPRGQRYVREFHWVANERLAMVSVVACLSNDEHSMVVHGSCPALGGEEERAELWRIVTSAQLSAIG